jgi:hypothetical protein
MREFFIDLYFSGVILLICEQNIQLTNQGEGNTATDIPSLTAHVDHGESDRTQLEQQLQQVP